MSLSVTVVRGYTMVAGVKPSVADWNAGFLPSVSIAGGVGAGDLSDDAVTFIHLNPNLILGGTASTAIGSTDLILYGDVDAGDNRVITFQNFLKSIALECSAKTSFTSFSGDLVLYWEADDTLPVTMNIARFMEQVMNQAPELTTTDGADTALVHDDSAADGSQVTRVRLDNLLPNVIAAQTVNNPTQVVVNAKGQVVGISGTEGSNSATSAELTLPTAAGTAGDEIVWAHGLSGIPMEVYLWLKCTDAGGDAGYAENDIIDGNSIKFDVGAAEHVTGYVILVDATNVTVIQPNSAGADPWVAKKDDGTEVAIDTTKWKAIIRARV